MDTDEGDLSLGEAATHLDDWLHGKEVPGRKIKQSVEIAVHTLREQDEKASAPAPHPFFYYPPNDSQS